MPRSSRARFRIGDIVTFNYEKGRVVHEANPEILCLHPNWECYKGSPDKRCTHGIALKYLDNDEKNYIRAVVNPLFADEITKQDPAIKAKLDKIEGLYELDIFSPYDFYKKFIRGYIKPRKWEPYRRYRVDKMTSVQIIQNARQYAGDTAEGRYFRYKKRLEFAHGPRISR